MLPTGTRRKVPRLYTTWLWERESELAREGSRIYPWVGIWKLVLNSSGIAWTIVGRCSAMRLPMYMLRQRNEHHREL